jgi:hypothetical protein
MPRFIQPGFPVPAGALMLPEKPRVPARTNYLDNPWMASASGGMAVRVTAHPGVEYAAKISPDGKKMVQNSREGEE